MPSVTILLPTYNGAAYLEEQVRSICDQTVADWRLLACDDGSTDATVSVLETMARQDDRIALLPATGNIGQRRRLLQLKDAADTELIAIADQDDVWRPDKLELLLGAMGDADLCFGSSWLIDGEGRAFGRTLTDSLPPPYRAGDRLVYLFRPLVSAHALVARRKLFNEAAFCRWMPFDWLMSLEAAFGAGIAHAPAARTLHRLHGGNQANGGFVDVPRAPPLISRFALRILARNVERSRVQFLALLEHVGFAESLSADTRQRARQAHAACHWAWFPDQLLEADVRRMLPGRIEHLLRPLAGSDDDWRYFALRFDQLCLPLWSPARFRAHRRRRIIDWLQ